MAFNRQQLHGFLGPERGVNVKSHSSRQFYHRALAASRRRTHRRRCRHSRSTMKSGGETTTRLCPLAPPPPLYSTSSTSSTPARRCCRFLPPRPWRPRAAPRGCQSGTWRGKYMMGCLYSVTWASSCLFIFLRDRGLYLLVVSFVWIIRMDNEGYFHHFKQVLLHGRC